MDPQNPVGRAKISSDEMSVELSSRRTGMSFQRTRMSADRTLMSVMRTSLSLISFGFTIYQAFDKLGRSQGWGSGPARNFGIALVLMGILMLMLGIGYQVAFMRGLRLERAGMKDQALIHAESHFPVSMTLVVALLLLLVGVGAILSMVFRVGPFG